jgi:hypothetical protein
MPSMPPGAVLSRMRGPQVDVYACKQVSLDARMPGSGREVWEGRYERWCDVYRLPKPCDDPRYDDRCRWWIYAFYSLLKHGYTERRIEFALERADQLAYPMDGPAPFMAMFWLLQNPESHPRVWYGPGSAFDKLVQEVNARTEANKKALERRLEEDAQTEQGKKQLMRYEFWDRLRTGNLTPEYMAVMDEICASAHQTIPRPHDLFANAPKREPG